MMKLNLIAGLLGAAAASAGAQDAATLERCRGMAVASERLACYDAALPPRVASPAAAATSPAKATATAPAATAIATTPSQPAAVAAANPAPPRQAPAEFGFESRRKAVDDAADSVRTSFEGVFTGWAPAEKIKLANGQVWQIADGSQTAYDIRNPGVRIVRGAFGSFFMEIEGVSHSPKVRRVQ